SFAFFFFSSRRRHTRFSRDWSSDVCSSDLDADQLQVWGDTILQLIANIPGTSEVEKTVEDGTPEVRVDIDRQRMADLDLTLSQRSEERRVGKEWTCGWER